MAGLGGAPFGDASLQAMPLALAEGDSGEYIASMLEGLAGVAGSAGMPFLAYLINVALEEARSKRPPATWPGAISTTQAVARGAGAAP